MDYDFFENSLYKDIIGYITNIYFFRQDVSKGFIFFL